MYKVVSLFAGCGGCDQGITGDFVFNQKRYERLPFELTYACLLYTSFVAIPSPVPNTNISLQYAVLGLLAAMYGPVAGGLIGFIGHTLIDLLSLIHIYQRLGYGSLQRNPGYG